MESILTSIKKLLGITEEYEHFDADIIIGINSAFMILSQLGLGPEGGFTISDKTSTWDEFVVEEDNMESVKSYVHLKTKLFFDPPASSVIVDAMERMIRELEWRLNVIAEALSEDGGE